MPPATSPTLFVPNQPISPYITDWHQAFAALDPAVSAPAEIWFDRGPYPPVVERVRLPCCPDARDRRLVELHLSALINNVLCTAGAKRVSIQARAGFDARLLAAVRGNLLLRPDTFSNMSLSFLHGLIESVLGTALSIDAESEQIQALRLLDRAVAQIPNPSASEKPLRPGTALAVNIGQHLTRWGLVRFAADGGATVLGLSRRETSPDGTPRCLTDEIREILAAIRSSLGAAAATVSAVGISLAVTVLDGIVRPVPDFGLFATCPELSCNQATDLLVAAGQEAFPGRPVSVVNDAKAQALYAFHDAGGGLAAGGRHLLAVRLGACPCVHCLDGNGHSVPAFDEYGWLVTAACAPQSGGPLFSTLRFPLSHYGVAAAAHELGLLATHHLDIEEAIPFFHKRLLGNDPLACHEAAAVYGILGAHLAMLAAEIHRRRPIGAVVVLGSQTNRLDAPVFAAMRDGYAAFAAKRPLVPDQARLVLVKDASARAGLIGAARLALARAQTAAAA
ncbi:hypothetical protein GTA51_02930 [Desulfovibrio aerotolerans]|uniref:ROK family protein n=1 Tax=Solidesulfovibrio aerotolerans TaxID=295255 RepID=A0A7C9MMT6_9BACT|nr:hypothetical protein [Solidesulfovibrio aerotolerans]MYL82092.1 hypothetical protein [Solidesulfovibrio aerotolerans]